MWWDKPEEPIALLVNSTVSMSSGFNGRLFDAAVNQNAPIQMMWDGQIMDISTWGIPAGAPNSEDAKLFVRFVSRSTQLAELTRYISYGPARKSANTVVNRHAQSGVDIRSYLPTFPANYVHGLTSDHLWYSHIQAHIEKRFEQWINEN